MNGEPKQDGSSHVARGLYGQRPSKSADAARRREFKEIAAMTPLQRVLRALALKERMRLISTAPHPKKDGDKTQP